MTTVMFTNSCDSDNGAGPPECSAEFTVNGLSGHQKFRTAGPVTLEGTSGTVAQDAGDLPLLASGLTVPSGATITVTFPVTVSASAEACSAISNTAAVTSTEVFTPVVGETAVTVSSGNQVLNTNDAGCGSTTGHA